MQLTYLTEKIHQFPSKIERLADTAVNPSHGLKLLDSTGGNVFRS